MIETNTPALPDAHNETVKQIVTCNICGASYASMQPYQEPAQAFPHALELAFMSSCHFCFRCRRPSCPQCWDAVHGVCGACVEEVHLPFRMEVSPLAGTAFPPAQLDGNKAELAVSSSLLCVHPGRFQVDAVPQLDFSTKETTWDEHIGDEDDDEDEETEKPRGSFIKRVERFLTVVVLLSLLGIALLITLTELSPAANSLIAQWLHIDIRGEIAYLWNLVHQLH